MWIVVTKDRKKVLCGRGYTCELRSLEEISNSLIRVYRGKKKAISSLQTGLVLQDILRKELSKEENESLFGKFNGTLSWWNGEALAVALEKVIDIIPVKLTMEEEK